MGQYIFSLTMCPLNVTPVMWYDMLDGKGYSGLYMLPSVQVVLIESLVYLFIAVARMSIDYLELDDDACYGIFGRPFRIVFGYILHFQMWMFGVYVGLAITWSLLGAILNPEVYL